ncbi:MAG TPA: cyclic nucleotide-binding domain-containing protein, partial [Stellaceae bacterium]|nr:cyclic nucleotide-binding domain-containing protein [Stellaceae bacterium]
GRAPAMTAMLAYIASALTVGSLGMKTMMPLRIVALIGNLIFVAYGVLEHLWFVLLLNLVILPVNVWRLVEIKRLIQNVRDAANENHVFDALMPFARRITQKKGELIIRKGDPSDSLYLVLEGSLWVEEAKAELGAGTVVGEIGVLSGTRKRTATVYAKTDCVLARVSADDFQQVYFTHPSVGLSLVRLVIDRLVAQKENEALANEAVAAS